eukprot:gene62519-85499_t
MPDTGKKVGMTSFKRACGNYRVWLLLVTYGACFGVEIFIHNIAAISYVDHFGLSLKSAGIAAASFGLLALFARAGLPLDPLQIYETVELRKIHEIKAAELACSRATEENFERLREILKASEQRIAAGEGLAREDREFHLEIVRATKNSVFHNICSVYYLMGEQRLPIYFNDPERSVRSHAEHVQIYEALLRRDGNLAQALMSAHLQGAESYWKGLIEGGKAIAPA